MTDKAYNKLVDFYNAGNGLLPVNQRAHEIIEQTGKGEVISFIESSQRDLRRHRCYFSLLKYIYGYMPLSFKNAVPEDKFYLWLKHLKGQYEVIFEFKDGTKLVEYQSISFARMSELQFREYIKNQLPFIYTEVIGKYFSGEIYDDIINTVENDYQKFFAKL